MRRLARSLLLATTVTTAALTPGAAVFASESTTDCAGYAPPTAATVAEYPLIVIGTVEEVDGEAARLGIEVILKGSAQGSTLALPRPENMGICDKVSLEPGRRMLLMLAVNAGVPEWPSVGGSYYLEGDAAKSAHPTAGADLRAQDLIDLVTGETDQVVVPPANESEGQGIEWGGTVLPMALALGIVFAIGLFLMRIWHRIDPS